MNLQRLLDKCRRDVWAVEDLDWSRPPRPMTREEEEMLVQTFVDMAGIERLAGALFAAQRDRVDDPTLAEIYDCFVADEERHAQVAERLAAHYDVHGYREYRANANLTRFVPRLVETAKNSSLEIANIYITAGEQLLDIALLRALDDACDDPTCSDAMARINRDESRHVAIDFFMLDYYADPRRHRAPQFSLRSWFYLLRMMAVARPFIRDAVIAPLDHCDPSGRRMREAIKRLQLAARRPYVAQRPFMRLLRGSQWLSCQPVLGAIFKPLVTLVTGMDPRGFERLYTPQELARVTGLSR